MRRLHGLDRRLLAGAARRFLARRTGPDQPFAECRRLLLVRVDERLGNLLCLQQLIDALRTARPELEVDLLAAWKMRRVASALQGIDRLHLIDKRWFFFHPRRWLGVIRDLRRLAYPLVIDASAWHEFSFTHAVLGYWSGAPRRIGYLRPSAPDGFHTLKVPPGPAEEYEGRQRLRLLEPLGIAAEPPRLCTSLGQESREELACWLEQHLPHRPRVGLWPGGRKRERHSRPEVFEKLALGLAAACRAGFVVLWGPGEKRPAENLARRIGPATCLAPPTDIDQLAGLLRSLDLVIINDTGPMHLAVAVGTPTLALFASGEPSRWGHPFAHVRNLRSDGSVSESALLAAARELLA